FGKQRRVIPAYPECPPGDVELGAPIRQARQQIVRQGLQVGAFPRTFDQGVEQRATVLEVDRTAVVRVDEVEGPQLVALIDVWYPGAGQFEQGLGEGVQQAGPDDLPVERREVGDEGVAFRVVE